MTIASSEVGFNQPIGGDGCMLGKGSHCFEHVGDESTKSLD